MLRLRQEQQPVLTMKTQIAEACCKNSGRQRVKICNSTDERRSCGFKKGAFAAIGSRSSQPRKQAALDAEALFLHVLQRGVQTLVVLVTERDKTKWIEFGAHLRGKKFNQSAHRARKRIYLGFSNGRAANVYREFRETTGQRNFLEHSGNLASAQIKANRFVIGNTHAR